MVCLIFQAFAAVHDEIHITSLSVSISPPRGFFFARGGTMDCSNRNLALFSTEGVVRLEMSDIRFVKLSYSVATSVTGN